MDNKDERRLILQMIENGKISPEDGLQLLQAVQDDEIGGEGSADYLDAKSHFHSPSRSDDTLYEDSSQGANISASQEILTGLGHDQWTASLASRINKWRRWWKIPLWSGACITIIGALCMYWAQQTSGIGLWFACAWVPFTVGLLIIVLALQSRTSRWLHVRIQQGADETPRNINISIPLPLRLSAWFLRTFGKYIPALKDKSFDELILALENNTNTDTPFYVEVEDGDNGERVFVYIA